MNFGILIVGGVESEKIRVNLADLVGVQGAEPSIRAGVTEIKCELPGLHLDGQRIGRRRREVHTGPGFYSKHTQSQTLGADQQKGGGYQARGAAREILNFVAGPGA